MKLSERDWLERVKLAGKIYNETHTANVVAINSFIDYMFQIYGYVNMPLNDVSNEGSE
jgi:hypothetical protein